MSEKHLTTYLVFSLLLIFPLIVSAKKAENKISKTRTANYPSYQNERLVIGAIKNLYIAQAAYFLRRGERRFGNRQQLHAANLIDERMAAGEKYGYYFSIQTDNSNFGPRFSVHAKPRVYRKTGRTSFYMDASCQVRGADRAARRRGGRSLYTETCAPTIAYDNEQTAIRSVRWIGSAQETYKATIGEGNYGSFSQLYCSRFNQ